MHLADLAKYVPFTEHLSLPAALALNYILIVVVHAGPRWAAEFAARSSSR